MTARIALVLRKSREYDFDYVANIYGGIKKYTPEARVMLLTDIECAGHDMQVLPLEYDWPGWWSKLELFSPRIRGDLFYMDLDTIITGCLSEFLGIGETALLSDLFRPEMAQSGLMYLTEDDRARVWRDLAVRGVNRTMKEFRGDGEYIRTVLTDAKRLQNLKPGRIVSYKADRIARKGVPDGASIVCFHGKPRPRDVNRRI